MASALASGISSGFAWNRTGRTVVFLLAFTLIGCVSVAVLAAVEQGLSSTRRHVFQNGRRWTSKILSPSQTSASRKIITEPNFKV